jgi:hypothetical protein
LLDIERKLWTNEAVFCTKTLIAESLLVFPETGVMTKSVAVEAMAAENAQGQDGLKYSSTPCGVCGWQTMLLC